MVWILAVCAVVVVVFALVAVWASEPERPKTGGGAVKSDRTGPDAEV